MTEPKEPESKDSKHKPVTSMFQPYWPDGWSWEKLKGGLSTFQIEKKLGIKRARLKEWMAFIPPTLKAAGRGTKSVFSRTDVYKLCIFKELVDRGFTRKRAAELVHEAIPVPEGYEEGIYSWRDHFEFKEVTELVDYRLTINMAKLREKIDSLWA